MKIQQSENWAVKLEYFVLREKKKTVLNLQEENGNNFAQFSTLNWLLTLVINHNQNDVNLAWLFVCALTLIIVVVVVDTFNE